MNDFKNIPQVPQGLGQKKMSPIDYTHLNKEDVKPVTSEKPDAVIHPHKKQVVKEAFDRGFLNRAHEIFGK
jgi:hypothetical protein